MKEISSRIKELIQQKGLTNSEFAHKLDVNPSIISHILSGRNKVSLQVVLQLKQTFPELDLDYLLTGRPSKQADGSYFTNVKTQEAKDPPSIPPPAKASQPEEKSVSTSALPPVSSRSGKKIEQVLILYTDKSVESYKP